MNKIKLIIFDIVETLVLSIVIILALYMTVASVEVVSGSSMEPSFHTGERILVEKLFRDFKRGDVVVLLPPGNESKHYIKRVIGIPGDIVKIFDCKIYIVRDDKKYVLNEEYLDFGTCSAGGVKLKEGRSFNIAEGYYMVLGDNRTFSIDSRTFGLVSEKEVLGRVIFRFWPPSKFGYIK